MVGRLTDGFEVNVDEKILNDWRFTMCVAIINGGTDLEKVAAAGEMVKLLLGKEGSQILMDHIAESNDGYVPAEEMMTAVTQLIDSCKEVKN